MQVLSEGTILPFYLCRYYHIERVNLKFCILEISDFVSNYIDSGPSITLNCKYVHAYYKELKRGKKSVSDLVDDCMKGILSGPQRLKIHLLIQM